MEQALPADAQVLMETPDTVLEGSFLLLLFSGDLGHNFRLSGSETFMPF